ARAAAKGRDHFDRRRLLFASHVGPTRAAALRPRPRANAGVAAAAPHAGRGRRTSFLRPRPRAMGERAAGAPRHGMRSPPDEVLEPPRCSPRPRYILRIG